MEHKNIIDKLSYNLWKHLNKRYDADIVRECTENALNSLTNELS